jgi:hypothetical protein
VRQAQLLSEFGLTLEAELEWALRELAQSKHLAGDLEDEVRGDSPIRLLFCPPKPH